ncbi:hypothetical protein HDU98_011788, partial [Podochytrium sp. JEL0797]
MSENLHHDETEDFEYHETNWHRWTHLLSAFVSRWIDSNTWEEFPNTLTAFFHSSSHSLLVVIINGIVLFWAAIAGALGYLVVSPLLRVVLPMPEKQRIPPSSVAMSNPNMFSSFAERMRKDKRFVEQAVREGLCRVPSTVGEGKARPPFNLAMAKLLLHLSALGYERKEVVDHFADLFGLKVETVGAESCSVAIFYSVQHNFIVIAFTGSSPFDLSELVSNAVMHKVKLGKEVLPGEIHE